MITLLCSYGILVYELLHRETAGAKHGEKSANASHNGMAETIERLQEMAAPQCNLTLSKNASKMRL